MDQATEMLYLQEILKRKEIIASKCRNKNLDGQKAEAWNEIKTELFIQSGKTFEVNYLQNKWINIQDRLKRKLSNRRETGREGGVENVLTPNYKIAMDILGRDNPKLSKIPNCLDSSLVAKRQDVTLFEGESETESIFQEVLKVMLNYLPIFLYESLNKNISFTIYKRNLLLIF